MLETFIKKQRALADKEKDSLVAYGMRKVLDAIESDAPNVERRVVAGKWVTPRCAAEELGVCYSTVMNWKKSGRIESRQPAGKGGSLLVWIND